jgi:hypothetical protein
MSRTCQECETETHKLYADPRDPPLEEGECLCRSCVMDAYADCISETEERLSEMRGELQQIVLNV